MREKEESFFLTSTMVLNVINKHVMPLLFKAALLLENMCKYEITTHATSYSAELTRAHQFYRHIAGLLPYVQSIFMSRYYSKVYIVDLLGFYRSTLLAHPIPLKSLSNSRSR